MSKLSVIIPTIYKKPIVLYKLIEELDKEEVVDEIIIISNAPCIMQFPQTHKLKALEPESNAFVNMSWNIGIKHSKNDNFLLLNDDILLPPNYCKRVIDSDVFNSQNCGLIGLNPDCVIRYDKEIVDDIEAPLQDENSELIFSPLENYEGTQDWGSAIFGKKENYYFIPNCFKIYYGDNYLMYQNIVNNKINYQVSNVLFSHIHSSSARLKEFEEIEIKDIVAWKFYKNNYIDKKQQEDNN